MTTEPRPVCGCPTLSPTQHEVRVAPEAQFARAQSLRRASDASAARGQLGAAPRSSTGPAAQPAVFAPPVRRIRPRWPPGHAGTDRPLVDAPRVRARLALDGGLEPCGRATERVRGASVHISMRHMAVHMACGGGGARLCVLHAAPFGPCIRADPDMPWACACGGMGQDTGRHGSSSVEEVSRLHR